jgi:hypothetical protein
MTIDQDNGTQFDSVVRNAPSADQAPIDVSYEAKALPPAVLHYDAEGQRRLGGSALTGAGEISSTPSAYGGMTGARGDITTERNTQQNYEARLRRGEIGPNGY